MPIHTLHGQTDLAHARKVQSTLLQYLVDNESRNDATVIAAVGELQVRVEAAAALKPEPEGRLNGTLVFRLAAAEAARLGDRLLLELAGQQVRRPLPVSNVPSLLRLRRQLGEVLLSRASSY